MSFVNVISAGTNPATTSAASITSSTTTIISSPSSVLMERTTPTSAASMEEMLHSSHQSFINKEVAANENQSRKVIDGKSGKASSPQNAQRHFASMRKRSILFAQPGNHANEENFAKIKEFHTTNIESYNSTPSNSVKDDSNANTHRGNTNSNNPSISQLPPSSGYVKRVTPHELSSLCSSTESLPRLTGPDINVENIIQIEGLDKIPIEPSKDEHHCHPWLNKDELCISRSPHSGPHATSNAVFDGTNGSECSSSVSASNQFPALHAKQQGETQVCKNKLSLTHEESHNIISNNNNNENNNNNNNTNNTKDKVYKSSLADTTTFSPWRSFCQSPQETNKLLQERKATDSLNNLSHNSNYNNNNNSSSSDNNRRNSNNEFSKPITGNVLKTADQEIAALSIEYDVPVQKVRDVLLAVEEDQSLSIAILKNLQEVSLHNRKRTSRSNSIDSNYIYKLILTTNNSNNNNNNNINNNNNNNSSNNEYTNQVVNANNNNSAPITSTHNTNVSTGDNTLNKIDKVNNNDENTISEDIEDDTQIIRLCYSTRETVQRLLSYLQLPADRECDVVKALNKANGNASLAAEYIRRADRRAHKLAKRRSNQNISNSSNSGNSNSNHNRIEFVDGFSGTNELYDELLEEEYEEDEDEEDGASWEGGGGTVANWDDFSTSATSFESTANSLSHTPAQSCRDVYKSKHKRKIRKQQQRLFCLPYSPRSSSPTPSEQHRIEDVIRRLDLKSPSALSGGLRSPSLTPRYASFGFPTDLKTLPTSGPSHSTQEMKSTEPLHSATRTQDSHFHLSLNELSNNNNSNNSNNITKSESESGSDYQSIEDKTRKLRNEFHKCSKREIDTALKLTDYDVEHARLYLAAKFNTPAITEDGQNEDNKNTLKEHKEKMERILGQALQPPTPTLSLTRKLENVPSTSLRHNKVPTFSFVSSPTEAESNNGNNNNNNNNNSDIVPLNNKQNKSILVTHRSQSALPLPPLTSTSASASFPLSSSLTSTSSLLSTSSSSSTLSTFAKVMKAKNISHRVSHSIKDIDNNNNNSSSNNNNIMTGNIEQDDMILNSTDTNADSPTITHSIESPSSQRYQMQRKEEQEQRLLPSSTQHSFPSEQWSVHRREGHSTSLPTTLEHTAASYYNNTKMGKTLHNNWSESSAAITNNNNNTLVHYEEKERQHEHAKELYHLEQVMQHKTIHEPPYLEESYEALLPIHKRRWTDGDALQQDLLIPSTPSTTRINVRSPREAIMLSQKSMKENIPSPLERLSMNNTKSITLPVASSTTSTTPTPESNNSIIKNYSKANRYNNNNNNNNNINSNNTNLTQHVKPFCSVQLSSPSDESKEVLSVASTSCTPIAASRQSSNASSSSRQRSSFLHGSTPPEELIATLPPPPLSSPPPYFSFNSECTEELGLHQEVKTAAVSVEAGLSKLKSSTSNILPAQLSNKETASSSNSNNNKNLASRAWRGSVAAVNMNEANRNSLSVYDTLHVPISTNNNITCHEGCSSPHTDDNQLDSYCDTLTPVTRSLLDDKIWNLSPRRPVTFTANSKHEIHAEREQINNNNNFDNKLNSNETRVTTSEINRNKVLMTGKNDTIHTTVKEVQDKSVALPPPPPPPPVYTSGTGIQTNINAPPPPPPPPPPVYNSGTGIQTNINAPPPPPPPPPPVYTTVKELSANSIFPSNNIESKKNIATLPLQRGPTKTLPINTVHDSGKSIFKDAPSVDLPSDIKQSLVELFHRPEVKSSGAVNDSGHNISHSNNGNANTFLLSEAGEEGTKGAKPEPIAILDPCREHNVSIILQFLRLPIQQIEASIRTFDELTLGEEHIAGLLKIIPNSADLSAIEALIKRHGGKVKRSDAHQYSLPVRFFLMTTYIDHYDERIRAWGLKLEFYSRLEDFEGKLRSMDSAVSAVLNSQHLPEMLIFLLNVSNFLNTGSRFQGAKGFPITQLPQIINFRTTDGKGTLLGYVVHTLEQTQSTIHQFTEELMPQVETARDIDVSGITEEVKNYHNRLQQCASLVRKITDDARWTSVLGKFIYKALPVLEQVEQLVTTLHHKMERLREFVCEPADTFSVNEVLRVLTLFCKRYDQQRELQAEQATRKATRTLHDNEHNTGVPQPRESTMIYNEINNVEECTFLQKKLEEKTRQ